MERECPGRVDDSGLDSRLERQQREETRLLLMEEKNRPARMRLSKPRLYSSYIIRPPLRVLEPASHA
jgi:hypothetical protein